MIDPNNAFTIPVPQLGAPLFTERVTLAGSEFVLTFDWHDRESRWYMHIADVNGNIITAGLKLIPAWPIYERETFRNRPLGQFVVFDPSVLPPALMDFGQRSFLIFYPNA